MMNTISHGCLPESLHQPTDQTLFYVLQKPHDSRRCCPLLSRIARDNTYI